MALRRMWGAFGGHPGQAVTTGKKESGGEVRVDEVTGAPRAKTRRKLSNTFMPQDDLILIKLSKCIHL